MIVKRNAATALSGGPMDRRSWAAAAAVACAVGCLLLAVPAAAAPFHPFEQGLSLTGLDHACGVAVDSEGDLYASSAGESKVEVLDSSHAELTSIPNAHEPCALAVDSKGNLYVSEKATGKVVRYHPSEYPPSGATTYSETTIDASGNAKGVSVDPTDDTLYVAEGNRIAMFSDEGTPGINEQQRVRLSDEGGTFKLAFEGSETAPIPYNASHAELQAALEAVSTIGSGNVAVTQFEGGSSRDHLITFKGSLAGVNVGKLVCDESGLLGSFPECLVQTRREGFNGHIGESELNAATGVAAYTYGGSQHFISAAEPTSDKIEVLAGSDVRALEPRATIDGSETPDGELGLASGGAYLGVDSKDGHIFSYDAVHKVVNEFEATGPYFTQIASPEPPFAFEDAVPTALAVDRSGGLHDGTVYATTGAGTESEALAFGPVAAPGRPSLASLSHEFPNICGTVVDSQGDVYAAGESAIRIYDPSGDEIAHIVDPGKPCYLAVDSKGNLYVADIGTALSGDEKVALYAPSSYPFSGSPTYTEKAPIETLNEPRDVAVDPKSDRVFVTHTGVGVKEYKSAAEGSGLLVSGFCGFGATAFGIDVYGANGDVYIASGKTISICDESGTKKLAEIDGSGSPTGVFSGALNGAGIAVDQANGHVLVGVPNVRGDVEEYEASGAFVAQYGAFTKSGHQSELAIDNSGGPNDGDLYVAYDDPSSSSDLSAFGPLSYGEPPVAATGNASSVGGTEATLNGTVDPRGFETTECKFQYVTKAAFEASGFSDLSSGGSQACAESASQIGSGTGPVEVDAQIEGLEPEATYCFRLLAADEFGSSQGKASCFGPPALSAKAAQPISYREATLRGGVDPSGLATTYRFEYGPTEAYGQSTPGESLSADAGPTDVEAFLDGLEEGTSYHFRLVAENEDAKTEGPDQTFETLAKPPTLACPNQTLRLENNSSRLPDCRAYELVTPADTRGASPHAENGGSEPMFNNWLTTPSGPGAGDSLVFFVQATLPGTEGNGLLDAYRMNRGKDGWSGSLFSPTYVEKGDVVGDTQQGISSDQLYSFWHFGAATPPGAFPPGHYLRTPAGFEALGQGSLGTDPEAAGKYISTGASHVIFATHPSGGSEPPPVQLEPNAPPSPIGAVYDRTPGGPTHVVSLLPGDVTPSANAIYEGATPDGSSVVFSVEGALYVRRNGAETVEVATAPASFAGISVDGKRVFYADAARSQSSISPADLFACDIETGPCAGIGAHSPTEIASDAKFVNVSADGSHAYFVSSGELEVWDGAGVVQVAALSPEDLFQAGHTRFPETSTAEQVAIDSWIPMCVNSHAGNEETGPGYCPSRTSSNGHFLLFQSHADLTPPYEGKGHSEIYRYDAQEESLRCVSCDPSGAPAGADADLQSYNLGAGTVPSTIIPGIVEDGGEAFFQTAAPLLPEDANSVMDVYEWQAQGNGGCTQSKGCLSLISSGQGDNPSYIYSMTPDGHDVFFSTLEKLIGSDVAGSPSIYDARANGGFPQPVEAEPCHGDACQGEGSVPPARGPISTQQGGGGNLEEGSKPRCPRGQRLVRRAGKALCAKPRHHKHRRARHRRRGAR
jgi:hypothetical protein